MAKRELEELEVDLAQPTPLSKKQKRLVKKGKAEAPQPEVEDAVAKQPARSEYAVWIGNLDFNTTPTQLREFIIDKTQSLPTPVLAEDITRIKMPPKKGFAYVDVKTEDQMRTLVDVSESRLDGRNLLIKDARSFEGRPSRPESRTPPSRILFVGNLSFDTVDSELEHHFQHCGSIQRVRMATFEDTGKCKGFAFIDFADEEGATAAMADKKLRRLNGRAMRMEYGEDRSKRRPKMQSTEASEPELKQRRDVSQEREEPGFVSRGTDRAEVSTSGRPKVKSSDDRESRQKSSSRPSKHRPTPGAALLSAARGKQGIVASEGKKVVFD